MISRKLIFFSLNKPRRTNPGMNDKKIKTAISLRSGMFNKIVASANKVIIGIVIKYFLVFSVSPAADYFLILDFTKSRGFSNWLRTEGKML